MGKFTPVACPLRVAASPLKGAAPAVRQSRSGGAPRFNRFMGSGPCFGVVEN
jgi:hypothetical protein